MCILYSNHASVLKIENKLKIVKSKKKYFAVRMEWLKDGKVVWNGLGKSPPHCQYKFRWDNR